MLLYTAFSKFHCQRCGEIAKSAFPPDVQRQMNRAAIAWAAIAVVAVAVVTLGILCLFLIN
jgi:hypothetical protein